MDMWYIVLLLAVRLTLSVAILWAVYRFMGMIPLVLAIPIAGVLLAKPILEAGGTWIHWAKRQPFAEWQGNYHEFAGTQIRIFEMRRELWVVDADLLRVIGEKPSVMLESLYDIQDYDAIAETRFRGFSRAGVEKILRKSDHYESKRMLLWLVREVYKPHARKQDLAKMAAKP